MYILAWSIAQPLSGLAYLCLAFFFTFPDGRLVPRWSWTLVSLWIVNFVFWTAPANSPFNINNWPRVLMYVWLAIVFGGSVATQIYRYRRVASPVQRQQIKWLIYGFAPVLIVSVCFQFALLLFPALNGSNSLLPVGTEPLFRFYYLPIPVCVGIALLRYRLWDIDVIINRTLVYVTLTVSVIGLYVLVVVGLGTLIQLQGSAALSLLATGLIAVFFQPLRLRLQRAVNRLLYGERDDPYAVLARLGSRLEATLVPEKVLPTIVETVAQTLKLPYVAIALLPEHPPSLQRQSAPQKPWPEQIPMGRTLSLPTASLRLNWCAYRWPTRQRQSVTCSWLLAGVIHLARRTPACWRTWRGRQAWRCTPCD